MSRLLTPREQAALDRALATRTQKQRRGRQLLATGTVLAATVSLGACATLGGNIKGDFACRAPDGMCAPTTTIDDAALAMISGDGASAPPAGPYSPSPDVSARTTLASVTLKRTGEKVLRIVFPAHVDGAGRFRESTAVHAVVEGGAWMSGNATAVAAPRASGGDMPTARSVDTSSVIQRSLSDLAASAPEVRFPDPVADADAQIASAETADAVIEKSSTARVAPAHGKVVAGTAAAPLPRVAYSATPVRLPGSTKIGLVSTSSISADSYSLPPKAAPMEGATVADLAPTNPMDAIRAQVAAQLGKARTIAGPPSASPLASGAGAAPGAPKTATKPANAPSLFPVSEVNR